MKPLKVVLLGAGNRGIRYATHMAEMPDKYQVVAVADPAESRRKTIQEMHKIPDSGLYNSWEEVLSQPKMADICVIALVDDMHYEPALAAIDKGYDLLLEKPVAQTAKECADIANAANKKGVKILVCHVLRYTPFFGKIKELLMEGVIGEVMSLEQTEAVGHIHYSHSYVRGNWHKEADSTPMLLAKCCHDLDMIQWLLDKPCKKVSSFGSLVHFRKENCPEGAPARCVDGNCPAGDTCPYNCLAYYCGPASIARKRIITNGIAKDFDPTPEEIMTALKTTHYGDCVYQTENDVVDHQVVNMEFAGGATATLTMNAFNYGGRYIRIYGTKGEIMAHMSDTEIKVYTFDSRGHWTVPTLKVDETINGGHGGGDEGIIRELYEFMSGAYNGFRAADINISVKNHLIGFAAEEARHGEKVVKVDEVFARYGFENN